MKRKHIRTWREYYLIFMIIISLAGIIHTLISAYSLFTCTWCSAPYTLAFLIPGSIYFLIVGLLCSLYFCIKKAYLYSFYIFLGLIIFTYIVLKVYGVF